MTCKHLRILEQELIKNGIKETFRGKAWSQNCREWVYFDCCFDLDSLFSRFNFDICIELHENNDTHSGAEAGLVCNWCNDALMGIHPSYFHGERYK